MAQAYALIGVHLLDAMSSDLLSLRNGLEKGLSGLKSCFSAFLAPITCSCRLMLPNFGARQFPLVGSTKGAFQHLCYGPAWDRSGKVMEGHYDALSALTVSRCCSHTMARIQ